MPHWHVAAAKGKTTPMSKLSFAIYYAGDAYTTASKIMGRQSAGKAFMRGVARGWQRETVHGVGPDTQTAHAMLKQMKGDGFEGQLQWRNLPDWQGAAELGALYYPAPPPKDFAHARNLARPDAFSIMGVTHTLSSTAAMDQLADLLLPPFKPWDALICTSRTAQRLVTDLHNELRAWWASQTGASRFVQVALPVIPLGTDCPAFAPHSGQRIKARASLGLSEHEVTFLFAGRLSFHAKGNPTPAYQALEQVAKVAPVVCIEAGIFPNDAVREGYLAAQKALAPSVRFLWVDGRNEALYQQAWRASDVFVSLSDNIQETFGLTPVEAMAAGLPVVVSDWDGYKDTVRDGIEGFRVPTTMPAPGAGRDLALRHALAIDTYDFYIGRTSLATVVHPDSLVTALSRLATQPELRRRMSAAALARAQEFDWPVILRRYVHLAEELAEIRLKAGTQPAEAWPMRADPFARFQHFQTQTLSGDWIVRSRPDAQVRLRDLLQLSVANYGFDALLLTEEAITRVLSVSAKKEKYSVNDLLAATGQATPAGVRALMWLWKFDLVQVQPA